MSNGFYIDKPLRYGMVGGDVMCRSLIDNDQEIVKTPDQLINQLNGTII